MRHDGDEDLRRGEAHRGDAERRQEVVRREDALDGALVRPGEDDADVLQHEAHPDRRDERGELGSVAEWLVGDSFDAGIQACGQGHGDGQCDEDPCHQQRYGRPRRDLEDTEPADVGGCDQRERDQRPDHEDVAVGEIDELDDAVDEGVPQGHEGEDQAIRDADDERLDELIHGTAILGCGDRWNDEPDVSSGRAGRPAPKAI